MDEKIAGHHEICSHESDTEHAEKEGQPFFIAGREQKENPLVTPDGHAPVGSTNQ